jgi:NAD(P)-dependent dehydrogenase (short-subunit alcohol dehydrogenase family)
MSTEDTSSLTGKVAVVTGGSSGIGAASVRLLAAAGGAWSSATIRARSAPPP